MKRLLEIEFIKLWNNRASKVLIITYFALLTCITLLAFVKFDIGPIHFDLAEQGIFNFPYIWHSNTFFTAFLKFFLLLVIVSMVANEYSNKTIKQNLIDGLSKKEFIASKFLTVLILAFISTIFIFIITIILGYSFSSITETYHVFSGLEYLFAFFVKLIGFFSMGLFFGMLIKRSAFAVGGIILYFFVEFFSFIFVVNYLDSRAKADAIYQFLPFKALWNLIDEPVTRLGAVKAVANQVGEKFNFDYAVHWYEIVIVLVWTAIFVYGSYLLLKRRDL
ncbi:ABC transporter permease [Aurantibacter sp.]|uniref:ABC transporter permease n=1 Tax=Aurantibacter sp. TaxID=2807103 RepID=UPI0035C84282